MQTLAELGEEGLLAALLARLPAGTREGSEIVAGAGDDCAVVRGNPDSAVLQLLKTDCVIEGVHYAEGTPPAQVGWKALCRPLSDIAAMGGRPSHALITLALPVSATAEYACGIYTGLGQAAERFQARIIGGETARSPAGTFISVTVTGTVPANRVVYRTGARPGDLIYVTGRLGGSFASGKHLSFMPRLAEGQWLTAEFPLTAMMDLSDGLGRDLPRLATASGTGWEVDPAALPVTPGCRLEQAIRDGEDYELMFTISPSAAADLEKRWSAQWPQLELTKIGCVAESSRRVGLEAGTGFDHFAA